MDGTEVAFLVVGIIVLASILYTQKDGMWNGFDYYNSQLADMLGAIVPPPGVEPPVKQYTAGGLPNQFAMLGPDGRWVGKYDWLGQNLNGRNAFPGDFDFSGYRAQDCGCGCQGAAAAQKGAESAVSNFKSGHKNHFGIGPAYADYLGATIGTTGTTGWDSGKCIPGASERNPQSCRNVGMNTDGSVSSPQPAVNTTGTQSSGVSNMVGAGPGGGNKPGLHRTMTAATQGGQYWSDDLIGMTNDSSLYFADLTGRPVGSLASTDRTAMLDWYVNYQKSMGTGSSNMTDHASGRPNPHIDSLTVGGHHFHIKKTAPSGYRGQGMVDETKGAVVR